MAYYFVSQAQEFARQAVEPPLNKLKRLVWRCRIHSIVFEFVLFVESLNSALMDADHLEAIYIRG